MNRARVTFETSPSQKKALDTALSQAGLSLPEWFEGQVQEITSALGFGLHEADDEIDSLEALVNPAKVKSNLEAVDWSFTDAETGYLSHDIHPYPAKFIPQLPRKLISKLSLRGELIYDPFGGSGTTALESILLGRRALSSDLHPLAQVIGEAKTVTLTREEDAFAMDFAEKLAIAAHTGGLLSEINRLRNQIEAFIPPIPNISEWFHDNAITELALLRLRIEGIQSPSVKSLAKAAFSKSILKASFQDEETRYARRPREVAHGSVTKLFLSNFQAALRKARALGPLLRFRRADFRVIDLRCAHVGFLEGQLKPNSVDLIVTSPPYPNSNDYHLYHRFRLFWLGFDPREIANKEIGSHLRHQKEGTGFDSYVEEMSSCLRILYQILRPGRYAVLVLGDGMFSDTLFPTAKSVGAAAEQLGWELTATIPRNVHKTRRSFVSAGRRLRCEHLLVLRKPPTPTEMECYEPPYKLWPYERKLQQLEFTSLLPSAEFRAGRSSIKAIVPPLSYDKLRRLTFVHNIIGPTLSTERTWQAVLENGDAVNISNRRKDPKYVTHGIHAYKGKFYPQLAKSLFNLARLEKGQTVLDPFCGSGTVLLEAYLNGLAGIGIDLNVLATKIARVKTEILEVDPYLRDQLFARFQQLLKQPDISDREIDIFPQEILPELHSWFPNPVLKKLGWILHKIDDIPELRVRESLEVLLSSIVREISQQEPRDLRIRRREQPLRDAPVFELLSARVQELRRRLQHFSERSIYSPVRFLRAKVIHGDARQLDGLRTHGVMPKTVDAVVTSPPYATALPYIDTDRLSILLLFRMNSKQRSHLECSLIGTREINKRKKKSVDERIDAGDFTGILSPTAISLITEVRNRNRKSTGGFRKQNTAALLHMYFSDLSQVIVNLDTLLKENGEAFFVVGDNKTEAGDRVVPITTGKALGEIGSAVGWKLVDSIPITVTTENRLHIKNSITENVILRFKKNKDS